MGLAQFVVFGLEIGSYVAVATIGFTLVYGIVDMINFAYGEYMTVGGYVGFFLTMQLGVGVLPALVGVTVASAAIGWAISRGFFTPLHEAGPIPLLLTSIGLGFVLRNAYRILLGLERRYVVKEEAFAVVPTGTLRFDALGGFFVTWNMLLTMAVAVAVFVAIHLLLTRTGLGIAMRATASNEALAELSGVATDGVRQYVWLLSSALAGLSGMLLATTDPVSPLLGFEQILLVLAAAILGGAGSPYGAVAGSYLLGLTIALTRPYAKLLPVVPVPFTDLSVPYLAVVGDGLSQVPRATAFVILVAVLLARPSGIAGGEVRST